MNATAIDAIHARLDNLETRVLNNAELLNRAATLQADLDVRHVHFAKKLDALVESLAFNQEVIRLLTARVQKVETELKEIET